MIEAGDRERADAIQKSLNTREDLVELSVLQGPPAPQPAIPDVNLQQGYLDSPNEHPAEVMLLSYTGINVRPLWGHPGGRGEHVKIGVIENRWEESNYDINWAGQTGEAEWNCPPVISQDDEEGELRHAISDLGILIAQDNGEGVIGIANGAQVRLASRFRCAHSQAQANALADAIVTLLNEELSFGDILLIEQPALGDAGCAAESPGTQRAERRARWGVPPA